MQQQLQYVSVSRRCQSKETYKNAPDSYEAGSPNFAGVVGMAKAMSILDEVGFDAIEQHEKVLNRRLIDGLKKIDNIIIYGDHENIEDRVGVVTFNFEDLNSYLVAVSLTDESGVATRRGAFCAHPYVWSLMGISDEDARNDKGQLRHIQYRGRGGPVPGGAQQSGKGTEEQRSTTHD